MPTFVARDHARSPVVTRHVAALAAQQYRDAELDQRIAAATPHELVAMLYEGARTALVAAARATAGNDVATRLRTTTRALSILDALDGALDHLRGGSVARALAAAYAQVRALIVAGNSEQNAGLFAAAAAQIDIVGRSWNAIAPVAARRPAAG